MKRFGVEWAQPASKDLENIIDYISQDNVDAAIAIFEKIKSKCNTLNQFSDRGRIVPERAIGKDHGRMDARTSSTTENFPFL